MHRISYRVALGGIITALCLFLMFLTGVMPLLYLALPMVAGALLLIFVEEIGSGWAVLTYAAVSLLSVFVTFDKEAALIFILFFGHYPILRQKLEKLPGKALVLLGKCLTTGVCFAADYYATIYILGLTEISEEFSALGSYALPVVSVLLLGMFLCYDYALGGMLLFYQNWFKPKILGKRR